MSGERRHFSTEQKAAILKRYLVDRVAISDLCDECGIKPNRIDVTSHKPHSARLLSVLNPEMAVSKHSGGKVSRRAR
jgi:transposase-like protein